MAESDPSTIAAPSISSLPELVLLTVVEALFPDARALAALASTCRALRALDCGALWEEWVARRFGLDELPPAAPPAGAWLRRHRCLATARAAPQQHAPCLQARHPPPNTRPCTIPGPQGPVRPPYVDGWLFYQGMQPPPAVAPLKDLPHLAVAGLAAAAAAAGGARQPAGHQVHEPPSTAVQPASHRACNRGGRQASRMAHRPLCVRSLAARRGGLHQRRARIPGAAA